MLIKILQKATQHIGGRFPPAFKKIIEAEVKARKLADATDFLKLAILTLAQSAESRAIVDAELMDPVTRVMFNLLPSSQPQLNERGASSAADHSESTRHSGSPTVYLKSKLRGKTA